MSEVLEKFKIKQETDSCITEEKDRKSRSKIDEKDRKNHSKIEENDENFRTTLSVLSWDEIRTNSRKI